MAVIDNANGFRAMAALRKAATDVRLEEIEGYGLDNGRVFLHTSAGYWFRHDCHTRSVGSARELREAMAAIEPCDCEQCVARKAKEETMFVIVARPVDDSAARGLPVAYLGALGLHADRSKAQTFVFPGTAEEMAQAVREYCADCGESYSVTIERA